MRGIIALLLTGCCGCATYENSVWTPDSLNYTASIDHQTHNAASYVGLTWNLKPHK